MAITKLKLLTVSDAAGSQFRSLVEVDDLVKNIEQKVKDLDSLEKQYESQFARHERAFFKEHAAASEFVVDLSPGKMSKVNKSPKFNADKVQKVVIPKMDALRNNFSVVSEMGDQVRMLEAIYNNVVTNFKGVKGSGAMLSGIKTVQKLANSKYAKACDFLKSIGEKYEPEELKKLVTGTFNVLEAGLDFKNFENYIYVHETEKGSLQFTHYVRLTGLRTDEGEIYPQFLFIFTCVMGTESATQVSAKYYVTVKENFEEPGKLDIGEQVSDINGAALAIGTMLELENISTSIGTVPHGLDPDKINKGMFENGGRVSKITVDPGSITFELLKGVKTGEANEIIKSLYVEIKRHLTHIKNLRLRAKPYIEDGRYAVRFTVANPAGPTNISTQDLEYLKESFGIDDKKLRRISQIINED